MIKYDTLSSLVFELNESMFYLKNVHAICFKVILYGIQLLWIVQNRTRDKVMAYIVQGLKSKCNWCVKKIIIMGEYDSFNLR